MLNLSQSATNIILHDVAEIVQQTVTKLQARVCGVLSINSIDMNAVTGLNEVFQVRQYLTHFMVFILNTCNRSTIKVIS